MTLFLYLGPYAELLHEKFQKLCERTSAGEEPFDAETLPTIHEVNDFCKDLAHALQRLHLAPMCIAKLAEALYEPRDTLRKLREYSVACTFIKAHYPPFQQESQRYFKMADMLCYWLKNPSQAAWPSHTDGHEKHYRWTKWYMGAALSPESYHECVPDKMPTPEWFDNNFQYNFGIDYGVYTPEDGAYKAYVTPVVDDGDF